MSAVFLDFFEGGKKNEEPEPSSSFGRKGPFCSQDICLHIMHHHPPVGVMQWQSLTKHLKKQSKWQYKTPLLFPNMNFFSCLFISSLLEKIHLFAFKTKINPIYSRKTFRPLIRRMALCDRSHELKVSHILITQMSIPYSLFLSLFGFHEMKGWNVFCFFLAN